MIDIIYLAILVAVFITGYSIGHQRGFDRGLLDGIDVAHETMTHVRKGGTSPKPIGPRSESDLRKSR